MSGSLTDTEARGSGFFARLWRRRWFRVGVRAAVIVVALRVVLALAMPWLVDRAAGTRGLTCSYDELHLGLLSGNFEVRNLQLRNREPTRDTGAEPYVALEYAMFDIDVLHTLFGTPSIDRAEVDGLHVLAEVAPDGSVAWMRLLGLDQPATSQPNQAAPSKPLDLSSPVRIDALRLHDVELHLVDWTIEPPFDARITTELRLSDVGRSNRLEMRATSPQLFDQLRVDADATSGPRALDARVQVELAGLHASQLRAELARLGLVPIAREIGFSGSFQAQIAPRGGSDIDCTGKLGVRNIEVTSDGDEAFGLDELEVDVDTFNGERVDVAQISVNGIRGAIGRSADGALSAAGIELGAASSVSAPASPTPIAADQGSPFAATCAHIAVKNGALTIHDRAVEPANDIPLVLEELTADNLSLDPARTDPLKFALRAHAEGIVETLVVVGSASLALPKITAELGIDAEHIVVSRLAPELEQLGIASTLRDGHFKSGAKLDAQFGPAGRVEAELHLHPIYLTDEDTLLFSINSSDVTGLVVDPAQHLVSVASIDVARTYLALRRDRDGALYALGLKTLPRPSSSVAEESNSAGNGANPAQTPFQLPRIEIGSFKWHDIAFEFVDEHADPPRRLSVHDAGLGVDGLALGQERSHPAAEPARVRATLGIEGLLGDLVVDGTLGVNSEDRAAHLTLAMRASGIDTTSLAPQLATLGLQPTLKDGSIKCDLSAVAKLGPDAFDASLDIARIELRDADGMIATLDNVHVAEAHVGAGTVRCASIAIDRPVLRAARSADGTIDVLGVRLVPGAAQIEAAPRTIWQQLDGALAPFELPDLELGEFKLTEARLRWNDDALQPPGEFRFRLTASANDIATGANKPPATFDASLAVGQILGDLHATGSLALDPHALAASGKLQVREFNTERLAPYLPPGITSRMAHGFIEAHFDLQLADADGGGRTASCVVDDFQCGNDDRWFAQFDQFALRAKRIDAAARVVDLDEVSFAGAHLRFARESPTVWSAFGFEIDSALLASQPASAPKVVASAPRALDHGPPATVRLGKLDVGIADVSFFDRTLGDDSRPIDANVRLTNSAPCVLLDSSAGPLPPIALDVHAAIEPLVHAIDARIQLAPFAAQPEFDATLAVRGIDGARVVERLPHLPLAIDGALLLDGAFEAHAHGELRLERGAGTEFDLSKPFGAEFDLDHVAFRAAPGGEVLAGLEGAHVDIARIDPGTGDIAIKSVELTKPIGRVERAADGIHVLGLVIAPPNATAAAPAVGPEPSGAPPAVEVAAAPAPAAESAPQSELEHAPDLRIERFTIAGLDFVARDTSVAPPVELPLDALDVDVRKFSTRALREGQAFKFNAFVGAGKLALPVRVESDSLLEGMLTATGDLVSGGEQAAASEQRPLFDEVAIAGNVAVAPQLAGWATLDLSALELPAFRGIAEQMGVRIGDGVLDQSVRVRFQGEQGMSVDSRSTFSHLSLSEPADGPIERYLALPAPLDSVLFLLEDYEGQHKVPINFRVTPDGLASGEITAAAVSATANVIAVAIASSPLRLAGTLTDLFGITGGEQAPPGKDALTLDFDPGASRLSASERESIAKLAAKLRSHTDLTVAVAHDFGGGDIARAVQLGNPALDDCLQLSLQLRQRKAELERRRAELAAEARVSYALGAAGDAAAASQRLRALDAEIGLNEDALDRLHELLKPGAERRREQRTRVAALAIASERVVRVRQALLDSGLDPQRIAVRQVRVGAAQGDGGGRIVLTPHARK